ncbi:MAG: LodA/GoxA family CTQ-dependent oxidase, partial [Marinoscillum sp.]
FKIYLYSDENPQGELVTPGVNGVKSIKWTTWVANKKSSWFQFMQQTGSGMGPYVQGAQPPAPTKPGQEYVYKNDLGYESNNANNPFIANFPPDKNDPLAPTKPSDPNKPNNPLRYNLTLDTSNDPSTIGDPIRQQLILDPGPKTLDGPGQTEEFTLDPTSYSFLATLDPFPITTLGSAETDADGNLVVLGGFGNSGTNSKNGPIITAYANNEGWFDDIADGPVTATIVMEDGTEVPVDASAWVSVAPPAYAPEVINQVNLYDDIYDIYVRELNAKPELYTNGQFQSSYIPNYNDEVKPILLRPDFYKYVAAIPSIGTSNHIDIINDSSRDFSQLAAKYLRGRGTQGNPDPGPAENVPGLMPQLAGDNPISNFTASKFLGLTATQFFILSQFANGIVDKSDAPQLPAGPSLDRAMLENCVGGAFCPGIEITWITRNTSIYEALPAGFDLSDLFRIKTRDMSQLQQGKLS